MLKQIFCLVLSSALLVSSEIAHAQINVELARSKYTIPNFNTDTLTSKEAFIAEDSLLKLFKYIKPIKSSKCDLEVRCFYKVKYPFEIFSMTILKGTKHRLWIEEYYLRYVYALVNGAPGIKLGENNYVSVEQNNYRVKSSNLTQLIHFGLFDYISKHAGYEEPTEQETPPVENSLQDLRMKAVFEVKLNDYYRSFNYSIKYKPKIAELEALSDGKDLFNTINQLTNKKFQY